MVEANSAYLCENSSAMLELEDIVDFEARTNPAGHSEARRECPKSYGYTNTPQLQHQ